MATTSDNKYIVKELAPCDHQALLDVAEPYVKHVTGGPTLMCLFLLHYSLGGKNFCVMNNCLEKQLVRYVVVQINMFLSRAWGSSSIRERNSLPCMVQRVVRK